MFYEDDLSADFIVIARACYLPTNSKPKTKHLKS